MIITGLFVFVFILITYISCFVLLSIPFDENKINYSLNLVERFCASWEEFQANRPVCLG